MSTLSEEELLDCRSMLFDANVELQVSLNYQTHDKHEHRYDLPKEVVFRKLCRRCRVEALVEKIRVMFHG